MKLFIPAFDNGDMIPVKYAYAKIAASSNTAPSDNLNPKIVWSDLPEATKSLALICVDDKVPSEFGDANKAGKIIPKDMPRIDFYHWVAVDINPERGEIEEGEDSKGIVEGGKKAGQQSYGLTGVNTYSLQNGGYDGPCPPWNDELMHEYHFCLYALDVPSLKLSGNFTGPDVMAAMEGHVLDKAIWTGLYSLNPNV